MYRPRRAYSYRPRARAPAIRGRGAYYYNPSPAFLSQARVMRGRGSYLSDAWNKYRKYIPRYIGAGLGMATGYGARAGYDAGAAVSKRLLGWGAYMSDKPTQSSGTPGKMIFKGNVPSMHSTGENGIRICHKECIGVITSTLAFGLNVFEINPGLNSSFPWLSGIARNFEQYNINGLAFTFKPTCSDAISAATISGMGTVSMSSEQNVYSAPPVSTIQMIQSQFAVSGKPSVELLCPVEQDKRYGGRAYNHLLVRTGAVPVGATRQLYDDVVFYLATDANGVAGVQLGQLFVSYDITFHNPVQPGPGEDIPVYRLKVLGNLGSKSQVFGAAASDRVVVMDTIGITHNDDAATGSHLVFDKGNIGTFFLSYKVKNTLGATLNWFADWTITGGTLLQKWVNDTLSHGKTPNSLEGSSGMVMNIVFRIDNPSTQCDILCWAVNQAITFGEKADLIITQVNPVAFV